MSNTAIFPPVFWTNSVHDAIFVKRKKHPHTQQLTQHSFHPVQVSEVTVVADGLTFELPSFPAFLSFTEKLPWPYVEVMGSILKKKTFHLLVSVVMSFTIFLLYFEMYINCT